MKTLRVTLTLLLALSLNFVVFAKPQPNLEQGKKFTQKVSKSFKKQFQSNNRFKFQFKNQTETPDTTDTEDTNTDTTDGSTCTDAPETLIIPLYSYDSDLWDKVINLDAYNVVAIVNPNSGVGDTVDPFYQDVIDRLVENQKTPIGYVYTTYGDRDIEEVKAEIDKWLEYYPNIKGFFLDEASSDIEDLAYYEEVYNYIKSKGNYLVVLNAGTYPDESYFNVADNIVIYENNPEYFDPSLCDLHPEKSSFIIYDADVNTMTELMQNSSCTFKYLTDDVLPNPYDSLPTYIDEEAELSKGVCN